VPAVRFVIVVDDPVPVILPGLMVQFPAGSPLRTTLPVATEQVGCVMVPAVGAGGAPGTALITAGPEEAEVHPDDNNVTVNKYVLPPGNPVKVAVEVFPLIWDPPGVAVTTHEETGNPLKSTELKMIQVGCVIAPTTGAAGVTGCVLIIISAETSEVQ